MIYQIKLTLKGSNPPIWRRIEVPADVLLSDFHKIIQTTMGWYNCHLHHFIVGPEYLSPPSEYDDFGTDYTDMSLKDVLFDEGQKIEYEYDFGDSWTHIVHLEKIIKEEPGVTYPRCTNGKRACPPEDCGGIWGYMNLEEIMKNKDHEEYEEMAEWLGHKFEPEKFNLDYINEGLSDDNYGVISLFDF